MDLATIKPGTTVVCTVLKHPRTDDRVSTISRLMRNDPENRRALRTAHRMRQQRLNVYNRGNRDWVSREHPAVVVRPEVGASWTMTFTLDKVADLKNLEGFVGVKAK